MCTVADRFLSNGRTALVIVGGASSTRRPMGSNESSEKLFEKQHLTARSQHIGWMFDKMTKSSRWDEDKEKLLKELRVKKDHK